jgi:hypothetical protein
MHLIALLMHVLMLFQRTNGKADRAIDDVSIDCCAGLQCLPDIDRLLKGKVKDD